MRTVDPIKHQKRRDAILRVAGKCFANSGFRGASIMDICKAAKVSPRVLYHYFPSKEAIIDAMAEFDSLATMQSLTRMARKTNTLEALLSSIRRGKSTARHGSPQLAVEIAAEAGRNQAIARIVRRHNQTVQKLLASYIKRGQEKGQIDTGLNAEEAATLIISISHGMKCLAISDRAYACAGRGRVTNALVRHMLEPRSQSPR